MPDIAAAIESLKLDSAALDGELIAGGGAKVDFNALQATLAGERAGALSLVLFDLLHIDGVDLAATPLVERKQLLDELLRDPPPHLAYSSHIAGDGDAAYRLAVEREFEGIVSKRADRPHHAGRSDEWRKTKHLASEVAYRDPREVMMHTAETIASKRTDPEGQEGLTAFLEKRRPAWMDEAHDPSWLAGAAR